MRISKIHRIDNFSDFSQFPIMEEERQRHQNNRAAIHRIRREVLRSLQSPSPPPYEDPPSYPEALKCIQRK